MVIHGDVIIFDIEYLKVGKRIVVVNPIEEGLSLDIDISFKGIIKEVDLLQNTFNNIMHKSVRTI